MLSRLASGFAEVEHALANYEFHEYAQSLYDLLWRDFCDWYLEGVKPTIAQSPAQQAVLGNALSAIVRMLHPAMPYVTEVIWEHLGKVKIAPVDGVRLTHDDRFALDDTLKSRVATGLLCHQAWPHVSKALRDEAAEKTFDRMRSLVTMIRDVRATHQVKPSQRIKLLVPAQASAFVMHADVKPLLMTFAGLEAVEARPAGAPPEASVAFTFESAEFLIPGIGGSKETEAARLTKQIVDLEKSVATLEGRLANPGYADRAPPAMVQQTRDELTKKKGELDAAKAALAKVS
jgi:valyl-tRNA synthetase